MAYGDPWDPLGTDRPPTSDSFLGQSPDFWQNLSNFGWGTVAGANQRLGSGHLANPGVLGSVAQGMLNANQLSSQAGIQRSNLAAQQATTQGQQLQNIVGGLGLPAAQAQANIRYRYLTDPAFRKQYDQEFGGQSTPEVQSPTPQAPSQGQQTTTGGTYVDSIAAPEGGTNDQATNPKWPVANGGPLGRHQLDQDVITGYAQANPQQFQGMTPEQISASRTNKDISANATIWLAGQNAQVLRAHGLPVTPTNLAITHALGGAGGSTMLQFPDNTPIPDAYAVKFGEQAANNLVKLNPQYNGMTVGGLKQKYANVSPVGLPPGLLDRQIGLGAQPAGTQLAQAGNGPIPVPAQQQQQSPQGAPAQQGGGQPGVLSNQQLLSMAQEKENQANLIERNRSMGLFTTGDPAALRQAAQQYRGAALEMRIGRPGSIAYQGTTQAGEVPIQSDEVVTSGPNIGMRTKVFRSPSTGQVISSAGGGETTPGLPPGAVPNALSPQSEGMLKAQPEVMKQDIEHDRNVVEGDLSHVLDNVIPAKQQLFQLRSLIDQADPGAAGQLRADFKNWANTFAPDFVSQIVGNASPAQEFNKIALMGAGRQERGDLGARGGFRAIELYLKANPSIDLQPTADRDMANALLVSHQFHEDYATGASDFYTKNRTGFMTPNNPQPYKPISAYDQRFIQNMRPELYASAISAMNGKPYAEWSKGLAPRQLQIVGGILQRTDPSAMIDVNGRQVNAGAFTKTVGPMDIGPD